MEFPLHCSLATPEGTRGASHEAIAQLERDTLVLAMRDREERCDLRDVLAVESKDRIVTVALANGCSLLLDRMADRQQDLLKAIHGARNELILTELLYGERPRRRGIIGELRRVDASGVIEASGKCEVLVYRDKLATVPDRGEIVVVPVTRILSVKVEKYSLSLHLDDGRSVMIAKLARELEPLRRMAVDMLADARSRASALLRDLLPEADEAEVGRWASNIQEGRMVRLREMESDLPGASIALASRMEAAGMGGVHRQLFEIAMEGSIRVGMRRRTLGERVWDDFWLVAPVGSLDEGRAGNALAIDTTHGEPHMGGTCFYRIAPRDSFRTDGIGCQEFAMLDDLVDRTCSALVDADFVMEPLFLDADSLALPENARHRLAVSLSCGMRELRQRFIGKVDHLPPERWTDAMAGLLRFNVAASNDGETFASADETA